MPKSPKINARKFQTLNAHKKAVHTASRKIMNDPKQREEFLSDPSAYLKKVGVPSIGRIKITARDREIINMVADPKIGAIYKTGNLEDLAQYMRQQYPGLVNDPGKVAWTVADFEVAIEAVAVAVGVFVAPIRPPEDFSELARLEAVQAARFEAMDARLAALEAKVQQLSDR